MRIYRPTSLVESLHQLLVLVTASLLLVVRAASAAEEPAPAGEPAAKKPDVNELIRTVEVFTNSIGMTFRKAGDGAWVGVYEVTQKEYQEVAQANPSAFRGETHPVDSVSWSDAMDYCRKLNEHEREEAMLPDGYAYTLPTQEQWKQFSAGVSLSQAVTSSGGSRSGTAAVGSLGPNGLGLFDVRGNVAEWCLDPQDKPFRVLRGGSWQDWIETNLRPEFSCFAPPSEAKNTFGFRCLLKAGAASQ